VTSPLTPARRRIDTLRSVLRHARSPAPDPGPSPPLISVILATYNWSSVLRHAVRSVLWQTYPNLELIVVGDGCTDDSQEVVESFADPRVRWVNLPENSRGQSRPNNIGLEMARGTYIAYQGHDDVWHPSHLASLVDLLERTGADLGWTLAEVIGPRGSRIRYLSGLFSEGGRELGRQLPPSSIAHRPELSRRIGGWADWREAHDPPDLDLLDRMQDSGAQLASIKALTVFKFPSGLRRNSYRDRNDHEQAVYVQRIEHERGFVQRELLRILGRRLNPLPKRTPWPDRVPDDHGPGWHVSYARKIRGLD
jgi:glycosyltransferase involved in cell wall biosynthesis